MGYGHAHNLGNREAKQLDIFDPSIRDNMEFREALARRDIATVYRLLCTTMGYSQRGISRLTEQSQSEISEILKGRQVQAYEVLVRIADGLGIPRGWMGLAHDATTSAEMRRTDNETEPRKEESESVKRRRYLAATATIMFGGNAVFGSATKPIGEPPQSHAPLPAVVTRREVNTLRALTAQMRALGRAGNGGMPDMLTPIALDAERYLRIDADSNHTARTFRLALAELHTLAGYCAHDMHLIDTARWHYSRATTLAGEARAAATTPASEAEAVTKAVSATWHAAIMERDHDPDMALKLLQLAQARGTNVITPTLEAALCVASARVYAIMGRTDDVNRYLMRSRDLEPPESPFDRADLDNVRAQCHLAMGKYDAAHHYAELSVNTYDPDDRRESTKARITLATVHAVVDEPCAEKFAAAALNGAEALHSVRVRSQLEPLETALAKRPTSTYTDLACRAQSIRLAA